MTGSGGGGRSEPEGSRLSLLAVDLLALTEDADLTVELEPATGSRLKGSYWIATIPTLGVTASALGLEATLDLLAMEAVGAADEVISGDDPDRGEKLPIALRVMALQALERLTDALGSQEVVSEEFLEMVRAPDDAA